MMLRILFIALSVSCSLYATALHQAVREINEKKVVLLLKAGSDVNALDTSGKSALHYAASIGRYTLVKTLVEYGADPHIRDSEHKTPLVYAIEKNRIRVIMYLSQIANKRQKQEDDALFKAARKGDIQLLSSQLTPENIDLVDPDGKTLLHIACEAGDVQTVKFLLNLGASRDILDHDGRSALNYAKLSGNKELAALLSE